MSAEASAVLALALYALAAVAMVVSQARRSAESWQVWLLYVIARAYAPLMFQQRVHQRSPIPRSGAALIIGNHRSPVDPLFIFAVSAVRSDGTQIRVPEFLTAREYSEIGGPIGFICRTLRTIPVDRDGRDMESAKAALRRLAAGHLVGIFPEGQINTGEGLLPAIPGVAWLALKGGALVYPAFIHGAPQCAGSMIRPFLTPSRARVTWGEPIDLTAQAGRRMSAQLLEEVTQLLMNRLAETGGMRRPPLAVVPRSEDRESA